MAARLDVDLVPARTVAVRTQQQQLVELELQARAAAGAPTGTVIAETYTTASRPAAGSGEAGRLIRVLDPGAAEQVQMCLQQSGGGWEWVSVGMASS